MLETIVVSAIESYKMVGLTIGYFLSASISIYDTRLIQWKKLGEIPADTVQPPQWTGLFGIAEWILLIILLVLNWKFTLLLWIIVFILKVVPVLEHIGKLLVTTFINRKIGKSSAVNEQNSSQNK